jgi:hypothetical protein
MYRQLNIADELLVKSNDAIARALQGGSFRTRAELGETLAQMGIVADGMRLGYFVHRAELDGLICSGPRRGKQFTYALLEERAPQARTHGREEALAELTKRYFTSHGPALVKDFAAWASLTVADIKAGLEMAKEDLVHEEIDGKTYWFSPSERIVPEPSPHVLLLPPYDECTGYRDHSASLDPAYAKLASEMLFGGAIMVDGQGVGYWRRAFKKDAVIIQLDPFRPLSAAEMVAAEIAAQRYGDFLGLRVVMA